MIATTTSNAPGITRRELRLQHLRDVLVRAARLLLREAEASAGHLSR